ncbi:hypothetical protein NADFUDRAFT_81913 [Nadsonia fulvescens var. elongata DSM 6958]|uniref:Uncharacterized protein n=1 Tax=Nadsonia fulvescens var. elongata DSM 6958 TaxID=857566 RepID=A0A1E3PQ64_9ASCO|nr:hypothetical protein NADFUDRAFT_81913 [Nadsonia fulvescens var. elongata DSM 6958]
MKPTSVAQLLRPWQTWKNGQLFYGYTKTGTKRVALTTKQGNKSFYKGTGSSGIGQHTKKGGYILDWAKVRTYTVPAGLNNTSIKPFVDSNLPEVRNTFQGYRRGPMDGNLYLQKLAEYIEFGAEDAPAARRTKDWKERG